MNQREKEIIELALFALSVQYTAGNFERLMELLEAKDEKIEVSFDQFVDIPNDLEIHQVWGYIRKQPTSRR